MERFDRDELEQAVKTNCDISDAQYWGYYSICGLLLSLRGLYRHEKEIPPWEPLSHAAVTAWIAEREARWMRIAEEEFVRLPVDGRDCEPFDIEEIGRRLLEQRLIYGAGFGVYGKPSFFLGELDSKSVIEGYEVSISGKEFVRDLAAYPAMLQDNAIFVRREALASLLWDKLEEMRLTRRKGPLHYAFSQFGIAPEEGLSESLYRRVCGIAEGETGVYMRHEIGEAEEGRRLGGGWKALLCSGLNRRVETYLRSVKDLLADTADRGMLKYIIEHEKKGALGFYLSFMGGFRTVLFPEMTGLFPDFVREGDWSRVEEARRAGYRRAEELAERALAIFGIRGEDAGGAIERELIDGGPPEQA